MKVVERLHTQAIARDKKLAPALVPNREREHAAQVLNASGSMLFIQVKNGFGIAMSLVDVSAGFELFTKVCMIVNFAVIGDVKSGVFICHRLMAALDVHNAQTAMPKTNCAIHENTFIIRTAMRDDVAHARQ